MIFYLFQNVNFHFMQIWEKHKHFKLIEVQCTYFINFWCLTKSRNKRKRVSRMWENAYLSIKNPRTSRINSSLCSHNWTSIHQRLLSCKARPLGKILDQHLLLKTWIWTANLYIVSSEGCAIWHHSIKCYSLPSSLALEKLYLTLQ